VVDDRKPARKAALLSSLAVLAVALLFGGCTRTVGSGCGGNGDCPSPEDGEARCLTNVEGGYCSATCDDDADCCDGVDCPEGVDIVCSTFEDSGERLCFINCRDGAGPGGDPEVCEEHAPGMECRNTGGGIGEQVCLPPGA
jgi:hypothetical protein